MTTSLALYQGTGLSPGEIPDTLALVEASATAKITTATGDQWITRQDVPVTGTIKIAGNWSTYVGTDYLVTGTGRCFWVEEVTAVNDKLTALTLRYDALTSHGGPAAQVWDGWVQRCHSAFDTLFSNTVAEDFDQLTPWVYDQPYIPDLPTGDAGDASLIGSTCELAGPTATGTKKAAITFEDPTGESVTFPITTRPTENTLFRLPPTAPAFLRSAYVPACLRFYRRSDAILDQIAIVRGMGAEASIVYSYTIPAEYVGYIGYGPDGDGVQRIEGVDRQVSADTLPFEYQLSGYTVKNKKVFTGQFQKYILTCPASGGVETYEPEVITTGGACPVFRVISDPAPEGRPYFRPLSINGDQTNLFNRAVSGCTWQSEPLAYAGASGSSIDLINAQVSYTQAQQAANRSQNVNIVNGAIGMAGAMVGYALAPIVPAASGPLGAGLYGVQGALGGTQPTGGPLGFIQNEISFRAQNADREQSYLYDKLRTLSNNARQPIQLSTSVPWGVQTYGANRPVVYRCRWSPSDIMRLDLYLSAYGYATSEPLTELAFKGRQCHNYVKATAKCLSSTVPLWERSIMEKQLADGVRVWHVKPSLADLYDNPCTGV